MRTLPSYLSDLRVVPLQNPQRLGWGFWRDILHYILGLHSKCQGQCNWSYTSVFKYYFSNTWTSLGCSRVSLCSLGVEIELSPYTLYYLIYLPSAYLFSAQLWSSLEISPLWPCFHLCFMIKPFDPHHHQQILRFWVYCLRLFLSFLSRFHSCLWLTSRYLLPFQ